MILSQLFFKVIDSFKVTQNFNSLTKVKGTFVNQITQFEKTFVNITRFNKLSKIIQSNEAITLKLNKTRRIKQINNKKYLEFLAREHKSNMLVTLVITHIISYILFFVFATSLYRDIDSIILATLGGFGFSLFISVYNMNTGIDDHKPKNDATQDKGLGITITIIILVVYGLILWAANQM